MLQRVNDFGHRKLENVPLWRYVTLSTQHFKCYMLGNSWCCVVAEQCIWYRDKLHTRIVVLVFMACTAYCAHFKPHISVKLLPVSAFVAHVIHKKCYFTAKRKKKDLDIQTWAMVYCAVKNLSNCGSHHVFWLFTNPLNEPHSLIETHIHNCNCKWTNVKWCGPDKSSPSTTDAHQQVQDFEPERKKKLSIVPNGLLEPEESGTEESAAAYEVWPTN